MSRDLVSESKSEYRYYRASSKQAHRMSCRFLRDLRSSLIPDVARRAAASKKLFVLLSATDNQDGYLESRYKSRAALTFHQVRALMATYPPRSGLEWSQDRTI